MQLYQSIIIYLFLLVPSAAFVVRLLLITRRSMDLKLAAAYMTSRFTRFTRSFCQKKKKKVRKITSIQL